MAKLKDSKSPQVLALNDQQTHLLIFLYPDLMVFLKQLLAEHLHQWCETSGQQLTESLDSVLLTH